MSTNIYCKLLELECTVYIAVGSVKKGQIEYEGPDLSVFH